MKNGSNDADDLLRAAVKQYGVSSPRTGAFDAMAPQIVLMVRLWGYSKAAGILSEKMNRPVYRATIRGLYERVVSGRFPMTKEQLEAVASRIPEVGKVVSQHPQMLEPKEDVRLSRPGPKGRTFGARTPKQQEVGPEPAGPGESTAFRGSEPVEGMGKDGSSGVERSEPESEKSEASVFADREASVEVDMALEPEDSVAAVGRNSGEVTPAEVAKKPSPVVSPAELPPYDGKAAWEARLRDTSGDEVARSRKGVHSWGWDGEGPSPYLEDVLRRDPELHFHVVCFDGELALPKDLMVDGIRVPAPGVAKGCGYRVPEGLEIPPEVARLREMADLTLPREQLGLNHQCTLDLIYRWNEEKELMKEKGQYWKRKREELEKEKARKAAEAGQVS